MAQALYLNITLLTFSVVILLFLPRYKAYVKHGITLIFISTLAYYLYLTYSFVTCNFDINLVAANTSSIMPLIYKISGVWANYEGSLFLFVTQISFFTYFFTIKSDPEKDKVGLISQFGILLALYTFVVIYVNPFLTGGSNSKEGFGMNPLLQDLGLMVHPPLLYLSYASSSLIFSMCINYLFKLESLEKILTISRVSFLCSLAGVALGSWWAYRELGWGGYWFFDPVENISLINLMCITAFHHSLLISLKQQRFIKSTIFLGISTFILVILGIFIIRSGLLFSVHTFALDLNRGTVMFCFVFALIIAATLIFDIRRKKIVNSPIRIKLLSKEFGIFIGNWLWLCSILVLLASIITPVVMYFYSGEQISVENGYFHKVFMPTLIPIILVTGTFAYMKVGSAKHNQVFMCIVASICACFILRSITSSYIEKIFMFSGFLVVFSTFWQYCVKTQFFKKSISFHSTGMLLSHFSIGLLTLSILFNQVLQQTLEFEGKLGTEVNFGRFNVKLHDIRYSKGTNYLRQIAEFWITNIDSNEIVDLKPELRFYVVEDKITSDADIYSFVLYDLYAVIKNASKNNEQQDIIHAEIYYKPCISLIWLSCFGIAIGIILSFIKSRRT